MFGDKMLTRWIYCLFTHCHVMFSLGDLRVYYALGHFYNLSKRTLSQSHWMLLDNKPSYGVVSYCLSFLPNFSISVPQETPVFLLLHGLIHHGKQPFSFSSNYLEFVVALLICFKTLPWDVDAFADMLLLLCLCLPHSTRHETGCSCVLLKISKDWF